MWRDDHSRVNYNEIESSEISIEVQLYIPNLTLAYGKTAVVDGRI